MRHKLFVALAIAAVGLALNAVTATAQQRARAKIPFDFLVGDKHLPAGVYFVTPISAHVIALSNQNESVTTIVTAQDNETRQQTPSLVFKCIGREHFLATVWFDKEAGVNIPKSAAEKEALRAMNGTPSKAVVALR